MRLLLKFALLVVGFQVAEFTDSRDCVIELECEECLPEYMPAVTSHAAERGVVRVRHGDEVALSCGRGHFLAMPRAAAVLRCDAGRYTGPGAGAARPLLDLGCQRDLIEDVDHTVEHCAPPLQGRAYEIEESGGARHLATLCFDADRATPVRLRTSSARAGLRLPAHSDARAPLSLLGNFNRMFDETTRRAAERLYGDEARLNRRLHELLKHERYSFAGQTLTAGRLLGPGYFEARHVRAAELVSNKVPVWRSVVEGNLRNLHDDVAAYLRGGGAGAGDVEVYAGTHGVLSLLAGEPRRELFLKEGGRFPAPRYVWTALLAAGRGAGVALVLLNDPFVTVSEVRGAVFCESACGRLAWLAGLARHRNYERPLLGLVFCCDLNEFAAVVGEMPRLFNSTVRLLTD